MKNYRGYLYFLLITTVVVVSVFMFIQYNSKANLYSKQVSLKEIEANIQNQEGIYVYYFQPNCPACDKVSKYIVPLGEHKKGRFTLLDLSKYKDGWIEFNISKTPTVIYYENGEEIKRIEGEKTEEQYEAFFGN